MKKTTFLILLLLTFSFGFGQTTLSAGEVAVTGINSETQTPADTTDEFSFVLLTDIDSGTEIHFTDCGWTSAGAFRNLNVGTGTIGEGAITWTAPSDLDCGTEIIIEETGTNTYTASIGTVTVLDLGFDLRRNGDQLIAFQGTTVSPTFLFGVHFADGNGWSTDATNVRTSAVPAGLTEGTNAFARNRDNIVYRYNVTSNASSILAALADSGNWLGSNSVFQTLGLPSGISFTCDATSTLGAGDVAITGVNSDDPDEFSFVLLTDIVAGTEINFTDCGWQAAGNFRNFGFSNANGNTIGEGFVKWIAPSDLSCGEEIIIGETFAGSNIYTASLGTAVEIQDGFALGGADQVIAFQGTIGSPTFLFGTHYGNDTGWTEATSGSTSAVPAGLVDGVNAVTRNRDNFVYKYNITGNTSLILGALATPGEFIGDNNIRQTLGLPIGVSFTCDASIISAGDIAITGANADDPDEFSFVLLTDVTSGTEINFTDCGWQAAGGFRNFTFSNANGNTIGEGFLTWTASSDLSCGTEIIILDTGSDTWSADSGTVVESETDFALGAGGDQIIGFQGTTATPQFLFAVHFANGNGWTDATGTSSSAVPAGLTDAVNALAVNFDNIIYDYSVTTNQSLILAAVADISNWNGSNGSRQTLGIPIGSFSCSAAGTCASNAFWTGTWTVIPDSSTAVFLLTSYDTSVNGSFNSCSLEIDAGAVLTVSDNTFVVVENDVTITSGNIIVETSGNFVQNGVGASAGTFTGTATLNKTTPLKDEWYYYTYWGSPVVGETIGNVFPNVLYDWRYSFNAANFVDTDGDDIDDDGNDWEIAGAGDTMTPGVGFAVAGERSSSGAYPRADNISFTGTFNTGDISVPITYGAGNPNIRWNFIGNPYPSAIDFVAFHLANSSVLEGVAYFWSQASPPDSGNPGNNAENLNLDDYAVFTIGTGGTAGGSGVEPNGFVASGQGFFIPARTSLTSPSGHSATFTNAMRSADPSNNGQFFKGTTTKTSGANASNPLENKLWVNLTSDNGVFNQILIGYVENATDAFDGMSYDAPKLLTPGYAAALYSNMENDDTKYVIQGKSLNSINENEVIKLGLSTTIDIATLYSLSIDHLEGDFLNNTNVYLKDNLNGISHNLKDSSYSFTSEVGEFNDRFEIVFSEKALSINDKLSQNNSLRIIELNDGFVQFKTSEQLLIKKVSIYDVLGRQLYDLKGNSSSEIYKLENLSNATYIVKVQLSNGSVLTKKIVLK
ncbi:T9SS sorting signal type C domain-containing protein [Cognatitamlana onchidii]|uniref:T9SS sorting signal type C domain-containing protein n=1 Tax=Cognatitamlana onchidii TaxID=2562860 RepID=UPI0010A5BD2C|nr:T9SS sorting signal type C domain-containing protein [Algibacter onchidii]